MDALANPQPMLIQSSSRAFAFAFAFAMLAACSVAGGMACSKKSETAEPPSAGAAAPAGTAIPAAAPTNTLGVFGKGSIRGTVHFTGKAPEPRMVTTPDPFCARHPIKEEDIVVGPGGGLSNVLVRVTQGVTGRYDPPATEAVVDQRGCMYRPRVQAVLAGQTVQVRNSDQTLHNVHTYRGASTVFNQAQIPGMAPMIKKFSDGGQMIKFKCDVHPWMTGYVAVATNPFFAVSGSDGSFAIEKLPPGTYTLEAWHERLGTRTAPAVTVTDDQPAKAPFEYSAP
jgi:plastocyanin